MKTMDEKVDETNTSIVNFLVTIGQNPSVSESNFSYISLM